MAVALWVHVFKVPGLLHPPSLHCLGSIPLMAHSWDAPSKGSKASNGALLRPRSHRFPLQSELILIVLGLRDFPSSILWHSSIGLAPCSKTRASGFRVEWFKCSCPASMSKTSWLHINHPPAPIVIGIVRYHRYVDRIWSVMYEVLVPMLRIPSCPMSLLPQTLV